jgi:hypothetical protein
VSSAVLSEKARNSKTKSKDTVIPTNDSSDDEKSGDLKEKMTKRGNSLVHVHIHVYIHVHSTGCTCTIKNTYIM